MKTPCEMLGYKVGDRFETLKGDSFSKGSIIELYIDDGDISPLFKLISGETEYNHCDGEKGAYLNINYIKKLEDEDDGNYD